MFWLILVKLSNVIHFIKPIYTHDYVALQHYPFSRIFCRTAIILRTRKHIQYLMNVNVE